VENESGQISNLLPAHPALGLGLGRPETAWLIRGEGPCGESATPSILKPPGRSVVPLGRPPQSHLYILLMGVVEKSRNGLIEKFAYQRNEPLRPISHRIAVSIGDVANRF
jgi:hypothetical protein